MSDQLLMVFLAAFIFTLGACLGSFGNVIIHRLPLGESIVWPSSRCPQCKNPIRWYDNIPILTFFILRGHCRSCGKSISCRYPLVEFLSGSLFLALFLKYGLTTTFVELAILGWGGLIASFIDLDHRILPDVFTLTGIIVGLLGSLINPERHLAHSILGVVAGGGFLWLVAYVYSALKHEEGMGGGDIKLLAWIGSVLGWRAVVFSILVSSITGSAVGGIYALKNKTGIKTAIPFGPFLVFAAILYMFLGPEIIEKYLQVFFPFT